MDLRVSIVSYNTRELLARCLDSLRANPPDGEWEVVVVDNASADDTVAMLADGYPEVRCLALPDNRGYAAGNNRALADCEARYFLILNSDIEVHEGALTRLVDYLDRHPQVGLTAARLVLPDGRVQDSGGPRPTLLEWFCEQLNLTRLAPVRHALGRDRRVSWDAPAAAWTLSRGTLDQLIELDWVRIGRRRQTPGRPVTFVVTEAFLDHFGLESARDLPGLAELRAAGLLESRPPGEGLAPGLFGEADGEDAGAMAEDLFEDE